MAVSGSIGSLFIRLGVDPSGLTSGLNQAESTLERVGGRLFTMGSRLTAGVTLPIVAAAGAVTKWGMEFDQAMTESLAIMQNVSPKLRHEMEETAKTVSTKTKFSAKEAAEAYYDLASAGLTAEEALDSLDTVAQFAQAGVMKLSEAGEFLAGSVTAVGEASMGTADKVSGMAKMADLLTAANNYALGTVEDFANAITNKSGQALRLYNVDVEEGIAALMAYAEQNIKGKLAGQQLYIVLRDLQRASQANTDEWKKLGIQVFDATGKLNPLHRIIGQMEDAFRGMTDQQQHAAFATLGMQDRSKAATLSLMSMSDEMVRYEAIARKAGGTTEMVAQKQMLSMQNQLHSLWEQFKNAGITIYQQFVPVIQDYLIPAFQAAVAKVRELGTWLSTLPVSTRAVILGITGVSAALGPFLVAAGSMLLFVRSITAPLQLLTNLMAANATSTAASGAAAATTATRVGLMARGWTLLANPVTGWIALAGTVIYGLKELVGGWDELYSVLSLVTLGILPALVNIGRTVIGIVQELTLSVGNLASGFLYMGATAIRGVIGWLDSSINKFVLAGQKIRGLVGGLDQSGSFDPNNPNELRNSTADFKTYWKFYAEGGAEAVAESMVGADDHLRDLMREQRGKMQEQLNAEKKAQLKAAMDLADQAFANGGMLPDNRPRFIVEEEARTKEQIAEKKRKDEEYLAWRFTMADMQTVKEQTMLDNIVAMRDYATGEIIDVDKRYLAARMQNAEQEIIDYGAYLQKENVLHEQAMETALTASYVYNDAMRAMDQAYYDAKEELAVAEIEAAKTRMEASGELARTEYEILKANATSSVAEIQAAWEKWYELDFKYRHASFTSWMTTLSRLSDAFRNLSQIAGGAFGEVVAFIGTVISSMELAGEGTMSMHKGVKRLRDGDTMAGLADIAAGGASIAAAFMQATDSTSKLKATLGGAMVGAQVGSMFGPIGTAIGAGVGALGGFLRNIFSGGEHSKVNDLRDAFIESAGGLHLLNVRAQEAGITLDALLRADTVAEYEAAVESLTDAFGVLDARTAEVKAVFDKYKVAWTDFTGEEKARRFGEALDVLKHDFEILTTEIGVDGATAVRLMKDEIVNLALASVQAGGEIPAALAPWLLQLAQADLLTEDIASQLLGLTDIAVPTFKEIEDAAGRYGLKLEDLGVGAKQIWSNETAGQILKDFELLVGLGTPVETLFKAMGDDMGTLVQRSIDWGLTIPSSLKPVIEKFAESGQLIGSNGQKITDLSKIQWAEPIESAVSRLILKLEELIEVLGGGDGVVGAIDGVTSAAENIPDNPFANWRIDPNSLNVDLSGVTGSGPVFLDSSGNVTQNGNNGTAHGAFDLSHHGVQAFLANNPGDLDRAMRIWEQFGWEGFSSGSDGFRNFGAGTPAVLHGMEAVVPLNSPEGQIFRMIIDGGGPLMSPWGTMGPALGQQFSMMFGAAEEGLSHFTVGPLPGELPSLTTPTEMSPLSQSSAWNPWLMANTQRLFEDIPNFEGQMRPDDIAVASSVSGRSWSERQMTGGRGGGSAVQEEMQRLRAETMQLRKELRRRDELIGDRIRDAVLQASAGRR